MKNNWHIKLTANTKRHQMHGAHATIIIYATESWKHSKSTVTSVSILKETWRAKTTAAAS